MTGKKICRIELRCPPCELLGRRRVPLEHERDGRIDEDLWRQRIQFDRARALGDRFLEPSLEGQRHAELIVRERVVGVERERPPEFALAPRQVVFVEQFEHARGTCALRRNCRPVATAFSAAALALGLASVAVRKPSLYPAQR